MQTETAEKIAARVKRLSTEQQAEILQFVEKFAPPRQSLWDLAKDLVDELPEEVLDRLPTDGSLNHDHYLYGAPKK